MSSFNVATPVSGAGYLRARLLLSAATAVLATGLSATSAFAADECGLAIAGSVTCLPAANPYPAGITYVAVAPITVNAPTGVMVNTRTPATTGIAVTSLDAATLAGAADVSTSGLGSNGVVVSGTGGLVSVSTGAVRTRGTGASAIVATNSAGAVTVNALSAQASGLGGNAIRATGSGPVTVTSGSARAVDAAAIVAQSATGAATVNLTGATVNSAMMDGVVLSGRTSTLAVSADSSVLGGANGVTIASELGSTVTNNGRIRGNGYAISATGGPVTINNTANGTITGALSLSGGGAVVNNAGTFNAIGTSQFGAGDRFNNSGRLTVGAGSTVPVAATLNGLPTLVNSGNITMVNGHTGDSLTTTGNYVGTGQAQLAVDVAPGAVVPADRLIIGGSATGSTRVTVVLPAGSEPLFNTGTVIVTAGAGSAADAFGVPSDAVNAGLVRYDVVYNPLTTSYGLIASPSDAAYNTARYGTALRSLWYKSADAVSTHMQSRRDALWSMGGTPIAGKFWLTMAGSVDTIRARRDFGTLGQGHITDTSMRQDIFGGQIGFDLGGGVGTRGGFAVGLTGGYSNSRARFGNTPDVLAVNAINGGAYFSFTQGNIFANGLGKYDYYWADARSQTAGFSSKLRGHAYGARGELGLRFGGDSMFVEPLAQISWVKSSLDGFAVRGTSVTFDDRDGLRGKAGARIGGATALGADNRMSFYVGGNYVHDFKNESGVTFANAGGAYTLAGYRTPDYGEVVAGLSIASGRSVSGFMEGSYTRSFKNGSDALETHRGVAGRAGVTVKF